MNNKIKGITPVVATILLLLITITLLGVASMFYFKTVESSSKFSEQQLDEFFKSLRINQPAINISDSLEGNLPDTTTKTGLFIVAYGDPRAHNATFLANNFDITIESTEQAKQVHGNNSNVVTLRYKEMGQQDTTSWWFDDWHVVNKEEKMFFHSTDPAGI